MYGLGHGLLPAQANPPTSSETSPQTLLPHDSRSCGRIREGRPTGKRRTGIPNVIKTETFITTYLALPRTLLRGFPSTRPIVSISQRYCPLHEDSRINYFPRLLILWYCEALLGPRNSSNLLYFWPLLFPNRYNHVQNTKYSRPPRPIVRARHRHTTGD